MKAVAFLGPSLPASDAKTIAPVEVLPPARMGDVYAAVERLRAQTIVVIDGYFERCPAVWHKEILYALSKGVTVIGAASMGALRACEMAPFGMKGVGRVFEAYAAGEVEDDDEVAVVHGASDDNYRPLSEAMINIRFALLDAVREGAVPPASAKVMLATGKNLFYADRNWRALFAAALSEGCAADDVRNMERFVAERRPNWKAADARAALTMVASESSRTIAGRETAPVESPSFEETVFWGKVVEAAPRSAAWGTRQPALDPHARLTLRDYPTLSRLGLLFHLVRRELARGTLCVEQRELDQWTADFRQERGLRTAKEFEAWLSSHGYTPSAFVAYAETQVGCRVLLARYKHEVDAALVDALPALNPLHADDAKPPSPPVKLLAAEANRALDPPDGDALVRWYRRTFVPFTGPTAVFARGRGFRSEAEFLRELANLHDAFAAAGANENERAPRAQPGGPA